MSFPIKEQIAQNIEDIVKSVQVANGYSYDLLVERYSSSKKYVPKHLKVLIYQDGEDRIEQEMNTKDGRELRIALDVFIQPIDTDDTPVDQYANLIEADITKALLATYTRGGLAIDTDVEPADPFPEYGECDGFTLVVKVRYRTVFGDPYTQQA